MSTNKIDESKKSIKLKIGRHEYDITENDVFMNNGSIVMLTTQSKERPDWGIRPNPWLSKRAIKEISAYHDSPDPQPFKFVEFKLKLA
jgi:hypothetical protein